MRTRFLIPFLVLFNVLNAANATQDCDELLGKLNQQELDAETIAILAEFVEGPNSGLATLTQNYKGSKIAKGPTSKDGVIDVLRRMVAELPEEVRANATADIEALGIKPWDGVNAKQSKASAARVLSGLVVVVKYWNASASEKTIDVSQLHRGSELQRLVDYLRQRKPAPQADRWKWVNELPGASKQPGFPVKNRLDWLAHRLPSQVRSPVLAKIATENWGVAAKKKTDEILRVISQAWNSVAPPRRKINLKEALSTTDLRKLDRMLPTPHSDFADPSIGARAYIVKGVNPLTEPNGALTYLESLLTGLPALHREQGVRKLRQVGFLSSDGRESKSNPGAQMRFVRGLRIVAETRNTAGEEMGTPLGIDPERFHLAEEFEKFVVAPPTQRSTEGATQIRRRNNAERAIVHKQVQPIIKLLKDLPIDEAFSSNFGVKNRLLFLASRLAEPERQEVIAGINRLGFKSNDGASATDEKGYAASEKIMEAIRLITVGYIKTRQSPLGKTYAEPNIESFRQLLVGLRVNFR